MAVKTDPQSLVNAGACYACGGDIGLQMQMFLGLLRTIALQGNPLAKVDPQSLMTQSACYVGCAPPMLLALALLAQIAQSGTGGGGGAAILGTTANPNGAITGNAGQFYVDTNLQTLWVQENAAGGVNGWVQFV